VDGADLDTAATDTDIQSMGTDTVIDGTTIILVTTMMVGATVADGIIMVDGMAVMRGMVADGAVDMAAAASRIVVAVSAVMVVADTVVADACGKRADPFRNWEGSVAEREGTIE
jgi:hypothetical protein